MAGVTAQALGLQTSMPFVISSRTVGGRTTTSRLDSSQKGVCAINLRTNCTRTQPGSKSKSVSWSRTAAFGDVNLVESSGAYLTFQSRQSSIKDKYLVKNTFTKEQEQLVKKSWAALKKDSSKHATDFFVRVFTIAPSAKRLFSFLRDSSVPLDQNPSLKTHALIVFKMTGDSAVQLGEKGALDALHPALKDLGKSHVLHGVFDEHFDVVKFALLETIKQALPDQWSPELHGAWSDAYDELVNVIKDEMKITRSSSVAATA